jgi:hypothetical protein
MKVLVGTASQKARTCQPENLKTQIPKISQTARLCQTPKFYQTARKVNFKNLSKPIPFQGANKLTANVGSYTQGRIAGDFLSSRNAARAERCTPKTTAAALDG